MIGFLGEIESRLDAKRRVCVPSQYRKILREGHGAGVVVVPQREEGCLFAMSLSRLEKIASSKRGGAPDEMRQHHHVMRDIYRRARDLPFDSNGRIMLPQSFCDFAHLAIDEPLLFVGGGDDFKIWNKKAYASWSKTREQEVGDYKMADYLEFNAEEGH